MRTELDLRKKCNTQEVEKSERRTVKYGKCPKTCQTNKKKKNIRGRP